MLADENASFRALLDDLPLGELDALENLGNVFINNLGRNTLEQALESGDFDRVLALGSQGATILADTGSAERTLTWAEIAGGDLPQVASIGIHRFGEPEEITRDRLDKLLAWNDGALVRKFLLLDEPVRSVLWPLGGQTLFTLVEQLDDAQLGRFGGALALWPAADRQRIAGDFLAGARTLDEIEAGPTPAPTFGPATIVATPTLTAGATATPPDDPAPQAEDTQTITLLGIAVLLLALLSALLLWRRGRKLS
jgi:hypothetical protein